MLEYDNSAFYYFALTLLVIYIIPGTWYAVSELFMAFVSSGEAGTKPRTKSEIEKAANLKKKTTGLARLNNMTYLVNLAFLVVAWVAFLYLMTLVVNDGEVSTFDPYAILGIGQEAEVGEIKKAYRKLSLKYHPDKNIGDKLAEEMFMRIAKAYEALTDETSKENYKKFGNPDGKQALEVSIGLPKIILENPKVVLVLYLIAMVVVIPSAVGLWYSNSKQFGEKNIKYETYNAFYTLLQETFRTKNLPEVVAASAECREINTPKATDNEPMGVLYGKLKNEKGIVKPKFEHPSVLRGNLLLHAHLMRLTDTLNPVSLPPRHSALHSLTLFITCPPAILAASGGPEHHAGPHARPDRGRRGDLPAAQVARPQHLRDPLRAVRRAGAVGELALPRAAAVRLLRGGEEHRKELQERKDAGRLPVPA
jgi:translocation protein SEC63